MDRILFINDISLTLDINNAKIEVCVNWVNEYEMSSSAAKVFRKRVIHSYKIEDSCTSLYTIFFIGIQLISKLESGPRILKQLLRLRYNLFCYDIFY